MSDKFKIVDRATFERMQQSSSRNKPVSKIRNSKYKRMSANNSFNLMQYVKGDQQGQSSGDKEKTKKPLADTRIVKINNKGKKREYAVKKLTHMKKSILQYRQKKRELLEQQLTESRHDLNRLEVGNKGERENKVASGIHSNNFREYCNCCKTPDLKKYCETLIRDLNHFQRRAYAQNQIKARAHKRFVVGFRQVQSYLRVNKMKLVIIATDCEHNEGDVSLDETIESIKTVCKDQKIPVVFAFRRREMAYFIHKKASISCIGILDYDGAQDVFSLLMEALNKARNMYESLLNK